MDQPRTEPTPVQLQPLPKGWRYLLGRRDVATLVAEFGAQFRRVAFGGAASLPPERVGFGQYWCAGEIEARATAVGWRFRLGMLGLPTKIIGHRRERFRRSILAETRRFCRAFPPEPVDPVATAIEFRLWLWHQDGDLTERFSRWPLAGTEDERRRATDPWWR